MRRITTIIVIGSALLLGACAGGTRGVEREPRLSAQQKARIVEALRAFGSIRAVRLILIAERNLRLQNYGNAIIVSTTAISTGELTDRGRSIALSIRATALGMTGRIEQARADIEAALLADPRNVMALNTRGGEMLMDRKYSQAEAYFNRSIAVRPTPRAHFGRALLRAARRQNAAALADINTAIALAPRFGPAYSLRGIIEQGMGRHAAARRDFQQALRLDKSDAVARAALAAMDRGRSAGRPTFRRQAPVGREGSI